MSFGTDQNPVMHLYTHEQASPEARSAEPVHELVQFSGWLSGGLDCMSGSETEESVNPAGNPGTVNWGAGTRRGPLRGRD